MFTAQAGVTHPGSRARCSSHQKPETSDSKRCDIYLKGSVRHVFPSPSLNPPTATFNMSTLTLTDLGSLLTKIGVYNFQSLCADFPNAHTQSRPTDIYRLLLTNILANLTGCDATLIYESIQLPNTLPNGDLVLPVPRLRLKGPKPNLHAVELAASFPENQPLFQHPTASGIHLPFFFTPKSLSHLTLPYLFERHEAYGRDLTMGLDSSAPT